jgi:hypothetical protein
MDTIFLDLLKFDIIRQITEEIQDNNPTVYGYERFHTDEDPDRTIELPRR